MGSSPIIRPFFSFSLFIFMITFNANILISLILLPIFTIIILFFLEKNQQIKNFSIFMAFFMFLISLFLWILFDKSNPNFQFLFQIPWISQFNLYFDLGLDGISLFFIILTTFLTPICLLISYESITKNVKEFCILFFILEFCLIISFSTLDLIMFYIFFESFLIPMFLIIGILGSRERKIKASYMFFIYTLAGSLFMFVAILHIFLTIGTTDYQLLFY